MKSRVLFVATLWMAISVALLSALAPLGPPSSRLTGSAFNPATTSVVLKARSLPAPPLLHATEPDGSGQARVATLATPAFFWLLPALALLTALWLLRPAGGFAPLARPRTAAALLSRRRARAPPAFS